MFHPGKIGRNSRFAENGGHLGRQVGEGVSVMGCAKGVVCEYASMRRTRNVLFGMDERV